MSLLAMLSREGYELTELQLVEYEFRTIAPSVPGLEECAQPRRTSKTMTFHQLS